MSEAHAGRLQPAHQFADLAQQHEADTFGIWVFLVTEIMFFGGLFTAYALYRWLYYPAFAGGSRILDIRLGAINTAVLLTSSFTMALSVRAAQMAKRLALVGLLIATMVLGAAFLVIKGIEYYQKFTEHVVPGIDFAPQGEVLARLSARRAGTCADVFLFLFFHDGPARDPHDCGHGVAGRAGASRAAG